MPSAAAAAPAVAPAVPAPVLVVGPVPGVPLVLVPVLVPVTAAVWTVPIPPLLVLGTQDVQAALPVVPPHLRRLRAFRDDAAVPLLLHPRHPRIQRQLLRHHHDGTLRHVHGGGMRQLDGTRLHAAFLAAPGSAGSCPGLPRTPSVRCRPVRGPGATRGHHERQLELGEGVKTAVRMRLRINRLRRGGRSPGRWRPFPAAAKRFRHSPRQPLH